MIELLTAKSEKVFDDWVQSVPDIVKDKTNKSVLVRDGDKIRVNFDQQVSGTDFFWGKIY